MTKPSPENEKDHTPSEIDDSILGTAKIDPDAFKAVSANPDRLSSAKYALAGLIYMFRREKSTKALTFVTALAVLILPWLQLPAIEAALILFAVGLIWIAEILNSAVEAVVDLATDDVHPMAKVAKDVSSAATLVSVLLAIVINVMLVLPAILDKL